ncbi:glycosyltransferase [Pseudovibrio denitrificans]|uniref:glycosyltransferase n=1 Tax=Pseudovibrio denitrificans TaxID=258256 RepID=UPI0039BFB3BD
MISALILSKNSEHQLVHTLSALVPASAEGILKEVVIADEGSTDGTEVVADASGAHFIDASADPATALAEGAKKCARSDWVLLIRPGAILQTGWQTEAAAFIERAERVGKGDNLIAVFPSQTEEFGTAAQIRQKLINAKHRALKSSAYNLPMLVHKDHLQKVLEESSTKTRQQQIQKILRASRVHWLNGTVVFQNSTR